MSSGLASLFPGVDLCLLPAGIAPAGQVSNLDNPPTLLKGLTIALTIILTVLAFVFAFGRLWANKAKRTWGDALVLLAVLLAITQTVLLVIFVKYYRHSWDVPLCWLNSQFMQLSYAYETMTSFGLFLAKTATLLLFHQIFQVSKQMRIAILFGIIVNAILYGTSIAVLGYYSLPHVGQSWDDVVVDAVLHPDIFAFKWGVGQSTVGAALDIYIFILPLPTIAKLNLSARKRIQLMAVFFTAVLGITASLVSLVYRVKSLWGTDSFWNAGILMICNQTELTVAIIVCSMPGFAGFMRANVTNSKLASTLRSLIDNITGSASRGTTQKSTDFIPSQPKDPRQYEQKGYYELNDTWAKDGRVVVDIEHEPCPPNRIYQGKGVRAQTSVDIEQQSAAPSEGSGRGLIEQ